MRRRKLITLLGGAAAAWPLAARAQQPGRMRRIGVLMAYVENDPEAKLLILAFVQRLAELGWTDGRNVRIDYRWAVGDIDRMRTLAKELIELQPDVIIANTTPVTAALQSETRTIPIVFVLVSDPVGAGFVAGLPRPGANITGFINLEASMSGKWVDLLTEIAPRVQRVAIMFNPNTAPGGGTYFLPSFWAACHAHAVESITAPVRDDTDIERVITGLGREAGGGLIVQPDGFLLVHREMILSLAARNKVPAIYPLRVWAKEGGLLSYGWDSRDLFRQAAPYVDRLLRGEKPSDLPVQVPTKFELVINRKVGDALGISIPPLFYILADEVIE